MNYEKPKMEFTALQSNQAVADPCWPGAGTNNITLYFNSADKGYLQVNFFISRPDGSSNGNCSGTKTDYNIAYIGVPDELKANADSEIAAYVATINQKPNSFSGYKDFSETRVIGWSQ